MSSPSRFFLGGRLNIFYDDHFRIKVKRRLFEKVSIGALVIRRNYTLSLIEAGAQIWLKMVPAEALMGLAFLN